MKVGHTKNSPVTMAKYHGTSCSCPSFSYQKFRKSWSRTWAISIMLFLEAERDVTSCSSSDFMLVLTKSMTKADGQE